MLLLNKLVSIILQHIGLHNYSFIPLHNIYKYNLMSDAAPHVYKELINLIFFLHKSSWIFNTPIGFYVTITKK